MPSCLLYETYQTRISNAAVKVHHSRDITWQPYLRTLSGHSGPVVAVAVSKNGAYIVSGSGDETLRVWDSSTGAHLARYQMDSYPRSVAFSADGGSVIASTGTQMHVWNWSTDDSFCWSTDNSSSVADPPLPHSWPCSKIVAVSNTGSPSTACAYWHMYDRTKSGIPYIQLWDSTGRPVKRLGVDHTAEVHCVKFSPNDSQLVSASNDGTMRLWDISTGEQLMKFDLLQDTVSFSPDGLQIFSASSKYMCVWDTKTGEKVRQRKFATQLKAKLSFSLDGTRLAAVNDDGDIHVFDTSTGACIFQGRGGRLAFQRTKILAVAFSTDGTRIFSGLTDGTLRIWDLSVDSKLDTSEDTHHKAVAGIAFSPDCTRICTWRPWPSRDYHIRVWDLSTGLVLTKFKGHRERVSSVAFSPNNTRVVSGSFEGALRIWDSNNGRQIKKLIIQYGFCRPLAVALSPDGTRAACGLFPEIRHSDSEPQPSDVLQEIQSCPPGSTAITYSADGSYVYSILSSPLDMIQWDTKSGKIISYRDVPYNQTMLGQLPLLKMKKSWIVPVSDHSRKLFRIPVTYLPLQNFYTYGLFVVLAGPEKFAILDFSHMSSLISH